MEMKKIFITLVVILNTVALWGADQITNIYSRDYISLKGKWNFIVDQQQIGLYNFHRQKYTPQNSYFADKSYNDDREKLVEYNFDSAPELMVPGDWNSQNDRLYYYEGTVWYRRKFTVEKECGKRYFLYFGAINYESEVALNGKILGIHKGGFTPFNYEVTDMLKGGENSLVIRVDNTRSKSEVPTINFDWWNYGGITRDVMLVSTPDSFIRDYSLQLDPDDPKYLEGWVQLDGNKGAENIILTIPELKIKKEVMTDNDGYVCFRVKAVPERWSPDNPKLYDINLSSKNDAVSDRIGFRTIEVKGADLLLNGKKIFLKGVAVHEETVGNNPGRIKTMDEARAVISLAKEMNCNFLRLAHYPHCEQMIRAAEEMGLMVWEEIPCYWAIDWNNPDTYASAEQQLAEIITRDRNRANIIIWSVANETPKGEARLNFLTKLIDKTRALDNTRLVAAALLTNYIDRESSRITVDDQLQDYTDLLCFNEYIGWYDGGVSHCAEMKWEFAQEKPVIITEFGGGAKYGFDGPENHKFTEQYLVKLYEGQVDMFSRIPNLSGTCPWLIKDFRSPRRNLSEVQDEYNRKGLTDEKGNKKKAFYVMQEYYSNK